MNDGATHNQHNDNHGSHGDEGKTGTDKTAQRPSPVEHSFTGRVSPADAATTPDNATPRPDLHHREPTTGTWDLLRDTAE